LRADEAIEAVDLLHLRVTRGCWFGPPFGSAFNYGVNRKVHNR
jgi:hypothetical protein